MVKWYECSFEIVILPNKTPYNYDQYKYNPQLKKATIQLWYFLRIQVCSPQINSCLSHL